MVQPIQSSEGTRVVSKTTGANQAQTKTKAANIDLTVPDTKEAKESAKRIETAKYQLEILKVQAKNPNIKPEEAKKLAAEIAILENVYKNSTYSIAPDGSVTFSIKNNGKFISVTDFRKAYGLQEGAMQSHLKHRHETESPDIIDAEIYIEGEKLTEDDYDENTVRYFGGNPATGAQGLMELDFMRGDRGSYIKYADGMVVKQVKTFWGGTSHQMQYNGMSLRPGEALTLSQDKIKKAE